MLEANEYYLSGTEADGGIVKHGDDFDSAKAEAIANAADFGVAGFVWIARNGEIVDSVFVAEPK